MDTLTAGEAGLCTGCLRTIGEIVEWGNASNDRKREILRTVARRRDET